MSLLVLAIVALLAVLAVRARADARDDEPYPGAGEPQRDDPYGGDPLGPDDEREAWRRPHVPRGIALDVSSAPPLAAVVAASYRAAGLADDPTRGWRWRSRVSALVPSISVRAGQNDYWREVLDPTISHGVAFDVRVAWHLDRLLFDTNEPRIAMHDVARRRERRRLATLVVHRYFDWLAARSAAAVVDTAECAAELDALTDGWFTQSTRPREMRANEK